VSASSDGGSGTGSGSSGSLSESQVWDNAKKLWMNGIHQDLAGSMWYI